LGVIFRVMNLCNCHAFRNTIDPPELYCYGVKSPLYIVGDPNLVGCRHLGLDLSPYASFYRTGAWVDVFGTYAFDKEKITTRTEAGLRRYRDCPFLDPDIAHKFIELWPEQVNVFEDSQWHYWPVAKDPTIRAMAESHLIGVMDDGIPNKPKCAHL
jgi:hypothetical protein